MIDFDRLYTGHCRGVVVEQPEPGKFTETPMTPVELAARAPAAEIARDIYRHANQAGVCYYNIWRTIVKAMQPVAQSPDGFAVVHEKDGYFVGCWRDREVAEKIVARSPSAKGEVIKAIKFID